MSSTQSSPADEDPMLDPMLDPRLDVSSPQYVQPHLRLPWIILVLESFAVLESSTSTSDRKDYKHDYLRIFRIFRNIFRFSDRRMLILDTTPNHDGSNLTQTTEGAQGRQVFKSAFDWYFRWLTFLHKANYTPETLDELQKLAFDGEQLIKFEKDNFPADSISGYHILTEDSQCFFELFKIFVEAFHRLRSERSEDLDAKSLLMKELMLKEDSFEEELSTTHVEDCILYKRVSVGDLHSIGPGSIEDIYTINKLERDCFFIRQLRQHGFNRPWKRLFLIKDDEDVGQAAAIGAIVEMLGSVRTSLVLDIRPLAISKVVHNCCIICTSEYEDGELVIEQHCGHMAHQECIFAWFDVDRRISFPCPMCRNDPGPLSLRIHEINQRGERVSAIPVENHFGFESPEESEARNERSYGLWLHLLQSAPLFLNRQNELLEREGIEPRIRTEALRHRELLIKRYKDEDEAFERGLENGTLRPLTVQGGIERMPQAPCLTRKPDPGIRLMLPVEEDGKDIYFLEAHLQVEAYRLLRRHPTAAYTAIVKGKKPIHMPYSDWAIWSNLEQVHASQDERRFKEWIRQPEHRKLLRRLLENPRENPGLSKGTYKFYKAVENNHRQYELDEAEEARTFLRERPGLMKSQYPLQSRPRGMPQHLWLAWEHLASYRHKFETSAVQWYAERDPGKHPNWKDQRGRIVVQDMPTHLLRAWRNVAGDFPNVLSAEVWTLVPFGKDDPLVQAKQPTKDEKAGLRNYDSMPLTEWYRRYPNIVPGNMAPSLYVAYKLMRDGSFGDESRVVLPELTPAQLARAHEMEEEQVTNWLVRHPDMKSWMVKSKSNIPDNLEPTLVRAFHRIRNRNRMYDIVMLRTWMREKIRAIHKLPNPKRNEWRISPELDIRLSQHINISSLLKKPDDRLLPCELGLKDECLIWRYLRDNPQIELRSDVELPPEEFSYTSEGEYWGELYIKLLKPLSSEDQAVVLRERHNVAWMWLEENDEIEDALVAKPKDMDDDLYDAFYRMETEDREKDPLDWDAFSKGIYDYEEIEMLPGAPSRHPAPLIAPDPRLAAPDEADSDESEPGPDFSVDSDEPELTEAEELEAHEDNLVNGLTDELLDGMPLYRAQLRHDGGANILLPPLNSSIPVRHYQRVFVGYLIDVALQTADEDPLIYEALLNNRPPEDWIDVLRPLLPYLVLIFSPYQAQYNDDLVAAGFDRAVLYLWGQDESKGGVIARDKNLQDQILQTHEISDPLPEGMSKLTWLGARRALFTEKARHEHQRRARDLVRAHPDVALIEESFLRNSGRQPPQLDFPTYLAYFYYRKRFPQGEPSTASTALPQVDGNTETEVTNSRDTEPQDPLPGRATFTGENPNNPVDLTNSHATGPQDSVHGEPTSTSIGENSDSQVVGAEEELVD